MRAQEYEDVALPSLSQIQVIELVFLGPENTDLFDGTVVKLSVLQKALILRSSIFTVEELIMDDISSASKSSM